MQMKLLSVCEWCRIILNSFVPYVPTPSWISTRPQKLILKLMPKFSHSWLFTERNFKILHIVVRISTAPSSHRNSLFRSRYSKLKSDLNPWDSWRAEGRFSLSQPQNLRNQVWPRECGKTGSWALIRLQINQSYTTPLLFSPVTTSPGASPNKSLQSNDSQPGVHTTSGIHDRILGGSMAGYRLLENWQENEEVWNNVLLFPRTCQVRWCLQFITINTILSSCCLVLFSTFFFWLAVLGEWMNCIFFMILPGEGREKDWAPLLQRILHFLCLLWLPLNTVTVPFPLPDITSLSP